VSVQTTKKPYLSLRYKLLIPLLTLGVLMFILGYFGARSYLRETIDQIMDEEIVSIREYVMDCINVDELQAFTNDIAQTPSYAGGAANITDPRYWKQQACLDDVHQFNPRAWVYTYYVVDTETMAFSLDMWNTTDPVNGSAPGTTFRREDGDFEEHLLGLKGVHSYNELVYDEIFNVYYYGATSPLVNSSGETIGGLAIYLDAGWTVENLQILSNSLLIIFAGLFALITILVLAITQRSMSELGTLKAASVRVAEGDYTPIVLKPYKVDDELSTLAALFNTMLDKVEEREEKLEDQVERLKVQIDNEKRKKDVKEIVESEFFQDLKQRAAEVRKQRSQKE
jgi:HAMP domain-containing protein